MSRAAPTRGTRVPTYPYPIYLRGAARVTRETAHSDKGLALATNTSSCRRSSSCDPLAGNQRGTDQRCRGEQGPYLAMTS